MTDPQEPGAEPMGFAHHDVGERFADLLAVDSVVLREGPRSKKLAKYVTIKDRHTGAAHHHTLTIESYKKLKGELVRDEKHTVSLSDEEADEIQHLFDFVQAAKGLQATSAEAPPEEPVERARRLLAAMTGFAGDLEGLRQVAKLSRDAALDLEGVLAAIDVGRTRGVVDRLRALLAARGPVPELQSLIVANPWLLGTAGGAWRDPADLQCDLPTEALARETAAGDFEALLFEPLDSPLPLFEEADDTGPLRPGTALVAAIARAMALADILNAETGGRVRVRLLVAASESDVPPLGQLARHLRDLEFLAYSELQATAERALAAAQARARAVTR